MTARFKRFMGVLVFAAVLVATGSCALDQGPTGLASADSTTSPDLLLGRLLRPTGLLRCDPLPAASGTETIGRYGGTLRIGPHTLWVPPGALNEPTEITGEIVPGTVNAVRFTPAGLQFDRGAYLTMSYANCNLLARLLPKRIAYVDDDLDILYFLLSIDLFRFRFVTGRVEHFSQYAVAW